LIFLAEGFNGSWVREMAHLLERRHDARFIKLMDGLMPTWRSIKVELNHSVLRHADWSY